MNEESFDLVESQLAGVHSVGAPRELRAAVLSDVHRELRAARWDRRLARAAAVLLVVGVGLNVAIGLRSSGSKSSQHERVAHSTSQQSLVNTAVVVAEATDAATGSLFARQLATMSGHELTADEAAEIDAAAERGTTHSGTNGNKG